MAIVTGPSQGIGRAIAVGLATAGADVALAPRPSHDRQAIAGLIAEIESLGRRALLVPTDVTQVDQVRAMVARTKEGLGRVDILVNNAGWTCTGPALDATEEDYDATMAATTKSVFFACQAAAREMIPQGGGRIVNIGSNFAISAFKTRAIYGGAKAAVHQLSRALSLEWAKAERRRQRGGAVHHRNRVAAGHPRASRLQGVGRREAADRTVEPARRRGRRGAVPVQRHGAAGRRPRAVRGRRLDDSLRVADNLRYRHGPADDRLSN